MRKYTVTMIEPTVRLATVQRVLRVTADSQADAQFRAGLLYPSANIVRVEGPHD